MILGLSCDMTGWIPEGGRQLEFLGFCAEVNVVCGEPDSVIDMEQSS